MLIANKWYDAGKWLVLILLPALSLLVGGLGEIYGLPMTEQVVATINLLAVFGGSVMQVSSHNYYQREAQKNDHS